MEEKSTKKISLTSVLLVVAIIAIIVMGFFIYKLNNDKTAEMQKSTELQAQMNRLNDTVVGLQSTINNTSNVTNNNTVSQQIITEKSSSTDLSTSVSNSSQESVSSTDSVNNKILGTWKASKVVDLSGNDLGLGSVFGSGIRYSNEMIFKENGVLSYMIGITASSDDGEYIVNGNTIKYGIPTDIKGEMNWSILTYIPEEDILKEELDLAGEKQIITYIRSN